jgi:thiol-disulfide isomerase/thioredoxin
MRYISSAVGVAAFALLLSGCGQSSSTNGADAPSTEAAAPVAKGIDRSHRGESVPDVSFLAPDGDEIRLTDLHGPLLVNLWATWCGPCVKELPTLNALSGSPRAEGLGVVAVSQDSGPQTSVEAFLAKLKSDDLGAYQDPKMALSGALNAQVLPTTILYDKEGRELWRYVGDLDWTSPQAAKLIGEARDGGNG